MNEFVAFSQRCVLSIGPLGFCNQCFHESSVCCSIIQPASTLWMVMDGRDVREKTLFSVTFVAAHT